MMFESIGKAVKKRIREYSFDGEPEGEQVVLLYNRMMRKKPGFKKIQAFSFKNNVLRVRTPSPIVAQELKLREEETIRELNRRLKKKRVGRIMYRTE